MILGKLMGSSAVNRLAFRITHGNHPRFLRFPRTFQCLAVLRQPLKLLETLEMRVLKRLASAVQLRPWPPSIQSLTTNRAKLVRLAARGFCHHKSTSEKLTALEHSPRKISSLAPPILFLRMALTLARRDSPPVAGRRCSIQSASGCRTAKPGAGPLVSSAR